MNVNIRAALDTIAELTVIVGYMLLGVAATWVVLSTVGIMGLVIGLIGVALAQSVRTLYQMNLYKRQRELDNNR